VGKKSDPPPAPDYRGAAQEQAQSSKDTAVYNAWLNRPTINTPFGTQSWENTPTKDPVTGDTVSQWTQNNYLSPDQQSSLDSQMRIQEGRSGAAETLLGQATGAFQKPFNWDEMPSKPGSLDEAQQSAYGKMSAMLEPGRSRATEALDTKLANSGLPINSEAYNRAKQNLQTGFTQQDQAMMAQAMGEGRSDVNAQQTMRSAAIAEEAQRRGMTLNELNALLTGQQVNMPTMPGFSQAQGAQGAQYMDAAKMQGDMAMQQQQMKNSQQPDVGALAGTAMMGAMMM